MGTSSSSQLSLVTENQGSNSGPVLVRLKHVRVEKTHLLLYPLSCQYWHLSLVGHIGAGPQPASIFRGSKGYWVPLYFGRWSEPPEGGLMVKRWVTCLKSSPSLGISGWAYHVKCHPEEAKPLWLGKHWFLLVAACGGPQLLDVLQ